MRTDDADFISTREASTDGLIQDSICFGALGAGANMKVNEGYYICQPGLTLPPPIFENFDRLFPPQRNCQKLRFLLFRVYPATDYGRIGDQSADREKSAHVTR
jgi:hypothetical protein